MLPIAIVISSSISFLSAISPSLQGEIKHIGHIFFLLFLVCTSLVIAGIVLEQIRLRGENSYVEAESGVFSPEGRKTFAKLGLWLLVIGMTGESLFVMAGSWTDGLLQDVGHSLLLNAEAQTGNAAKSAEADSGDAKAKSASQLQDMLGPRWKLLEDHKAAFIKALKPFAPQRIMVVNCRLPGAAEQEEANKLEVDLINFLGKKDGAGWVVGSKDAKSWEECRFATLNLTPVGVGIVLGISSTADVAAKDSTTVSAKKLEDTLNKLRITTWTAPDTRADNAYFAGPGSFWKLLDSGPKTVFLFVGPNPSFSLTNRRPN
jgi:hypothetical protein